MASSGRIFFLFLFLLATSLFCSGVSGAEEEEEEEEQGGGDKGAEEKAKKEKKPVTRLQIGVKKRVEDCKMRSRRGDLLSIDYTGSLEDGTVFDSSLDRGVPITFTLGSGQVIKGWDQGLIGMCEGEKRKLVIPPDLGYGSSGAGEKIPGNSVLHFDVELVKIERKDEL